MPQRGAQTSDTIEPHIICTLFARVALVGSHIVKLNTSPVDLTTTPISVGKFPVYESAWARKCGCYALPCKYETLFPALCTRKAISCVTVTSIPACTQAGHLKQFYTRTVLINKNHYISPAMRVRITCKSSAK